MSTRPVADLYVTDLDDLPLDDMSDAELKAIEKKWSSMIAKMKKQRAELGIRYAKRLFPFERGDLIERSDGTQRVVLGWIWKHSAHLQISKLKKDGTLSRAPVSPLWSHHGLNNWRKVGTFDLETT